MSEDERIIHFDTAEVGEPMKPMKYDGYGEPMSDHRAFGQQLGAKRMSEGRHPVSGKPDVDRPIQAGDNVWHKDERATLRAVEVSKDTPSAFQGELAVNVMQCGFWMDSAELLRILSPAEVRSLEPGDKVIDTRTGETCVVGNFYKAKSGMVAPMIDYSDGRSIDPEVAPDRDLMTFALKPKDTE